MTNLAWFATEAVGGHLPDLAQCFATDEMIPDAPLEILSKGGLKIEPQLIRKASQTMRRLA